MDQKDVDIENDDATMGNNHKIDDSKNGVKPMTAHDNIHNIDDNHLDASQKITDDDKIDDTLWRSVIKLGGYHQVTGEAFLPPKTCKTVSWTFQQLYEKALLEYKRHMVQTRKIELPLATVFPEAPIVDIEANGHQTPGSGSGGRLVKLKCSVHNYDWGRIGYDSRVARLFKRNCGGEIDEKKHYAEFWMGTHVSGPSFVEQENMSLKTWILQNPKVLGDVVLRRWGRDLPFLLKVLSVGRSLSIQAHPDKELAGLLHKLQPNVYKDANHKPEMALALTEFEALCGFISSEELDAVLETVVEIKEVVGDAIAVQILTSDKQNGEVKEERVLRSIFTKLMSVDREVISKALSRLVSRLSMEKETRKLTSKEELVLKLEKQYPNDVGVLAALLLNHVKLEPGDGLYIGANEPHAYLNGECIECMAASDNVVRAGLTPKYMDVKILCSMLTYKQGLPKILKGVSLNPYVKRYTPPFEEFEVDQCILEQGRSVVFPALPGPSIFVVISGEGSMQTSLFQQQEKEDRVTEGDALFAPAGTEVRVTTTESELHLYRAGVNNKVLMNP